MTFIDLWIALPLLILAGGSLLVLITGAIIPGRTGTSIGCVATLGAAIWSAQVPPANIAPTIGLAATPQARFFTILFCLVATAVLLLSHDSNERDGITGEEYPATVLFTVFGMTALAASTNMLIMFLGLEAMTFGFYILVAINLKLKTSSEAGLKYLLTGTVSAAFLAFGIALHYAGTGSLEMADALLHAAGNRIATIGWGMIIIGMAFKLSLVPAHLWTPDVYQGAPGPVVAFLSAGSKGAAVAMLLLLLPSGGAEMLRIPLWWLALLSILVGNFAALLQSSIRRMLAYSSIAQMGYVVLALISGTSCGYRAAAFYMVAYAAMSLAAFGSVTILEQGGYGNKVEDLRGAGFKHQFVCGVLAMTMFALAGIPPTAGFTGKFLIFMSAIRAGELMLAVIGILSAVMSAYYYLRVVLSIYSKHGKEPVHYPAPAAGVSVLAVLAIFIVFLGIYPSPLLQLLGAILPIK